MTVKKVKPASCESDHKFFLFLLVSTVFLALVSFYWLNVRTQARNAERVQASVQLAADQAKKTALMDFVNTAANYLAKNGKIDSFTAFKKNSQWRMGDQYIFVYDLTGETLCLPADPKLEGANRLSVKDSQGIAYVKYMVDYLKNNDSGWVSYLYPKPGAKTESEKLSYFRKVVVGKETLLIGSGYYID